MGYKEESKGTKEEKKVQLKVIKKKKNTGYKVTLRSLLTAAGNTNVFQMAQIWKMNESEKPEGDTEG